MLNGEDFFAQKTALFAQKIGAKKRVKTFFEERNFLTRNWKK